MLKVVLFDCFSVGSKVFPEPPPQNPYGVRLSKKLKFGTKFSFSEERQKVTFLHVLCFFERSVGRPILKSMRSPIR